MSSEGDRSSEAHGYDLRPRDALERDSTSSQLGEEQSVEEAEVSRRAETSISHPGSLVGEEPSTKSLLGMVMHLLQESADERRRSEERHRLLVEEGKRDKAQSKREELERQDAEERRRSEDRESERRQREADQRWRETQAKEKREAETLLQGLRTFPKISTTQTLPSQLSNFSTLMDSLGVEDRKKADKLPEVLSGPVAVAFHNMTRREDMPFEEVRQKMLAAAGLTAVSASKAFMKPDLEQLNKIGAVEVCGNVRSLLERILVNASKKEEIISVCVGMFLAINGTHNLVTALAGCDNTKIDEVVDVACRTYETFGSIIKCENKSNVRKVEGNGRSRGVDKPKCYTCGKIGHKAIECREKENKSASVVCYACNEKGHYSSSCPNKSNESSTPSRNKVDEKNKNVKKNSVVEVSEEVEDNCMRVTVNGKEVKMLIDSGAGISVLPENIVPPECYTGETIKLRDFEGINDRSRQIAVVDICVGDQVIKERVAVSNQHDLCGLLKMSCTDRDRMTIVFTEFYKQKGSTTVSAVQTRAQKREEEEELAAESEQLADEGIIMQERRDEEKPEQSTMLESEGEEECQQDKRPVDEKESEEKGLELECVREGNDREVFVKEIQEDETLKACKHLASQKERGYKWDKGILLHVIVDPVHGETPRIVLPVSRRSVVLRLAHDKLGHLGYRKIKQMISKRFTWPGIGQEIEKYCASCEVCQRASRSGQRKAPMVERPVLTEPFESVAIDLVGPLPASRGKYRYLLTAVCLATRWPEVVPLKSVTARVVADGLVQIFGRTGLPLVILSDNGSQFTGKLMRELLTILEIDIKHTTPYHPQCNGTVERMHATLESMLRKACKDGGNWVDQIPFILFALRQMPSSTTGFSPYELVWGRVMRTPLDVLYSGWRDQELRRMDCSEWAIRLSDKLEEMRDWAVSRSVEASKKRKELYDRGKSVREFNVGEKIWLKIPGKASKLEDAWEGPFEVVKRLNEVNYKVKKDGKKRMRVIHVNSGKRYVERTSVGAVTVIADEFEDESDKEYMSVGGDVNTRALADVKIVLDEFGDILDGSVGLFEGEPVVITLDDDAVPIARKPYRIPDTMKPKVKEAVEMLVEKGWAEESDSPWGSPIVPIVKTDGSVRVCINYKEVNSVTRQVHYPIPHFDDLMGKVGEAKVVSKLDLAKGYYQVELAEESRDLTAFVTPWGSYRFRVLPFGLKNAPAVFQKMMSKVLRSCENVSIVYIDDILVYSKEVEEHASDVRRVLSAIKSSGLKLNPQKCEWARTRVQFLGHIVGGGSISIPEARVEALRTFKKPRSRRDMRAFLGTIGYYRKFVKDFANVSACLAHVTSVKKPNVVSWTSEMDVAFDVLRECLCNVCKLHIPVSGDVFCVHTDASGRGVSGVLYVVREKEELPVAFYSKQLQGAEKRYSATELEALAVVRSVQHFLPYLYGREFVVITDHAPLMYLMSAKALNRRLRGFMMKLMEFDLKIVYRPGVDNADADGLSRQAWTPDCDSSVAVPVGSPWVRSSARGGVRPATQKEEDRSKEKEKERQKGGAP